MDDALLVETGAILSDWINVKNSAWPASNALAANIQIAHKKGEASQRGFPFLHSGLTDRSGKKMRQRCYLCAGNRCSLQLAHHQFWRYLTSGSTGILLALCVIKSRNTSAPSTIT